MHNPKKATWILTGTIAAMIVIACVILAPAALAAERVAISVNAANVRSGPGTDYEMLWRMERYTPLKALSVRGDWIFFEDFEGTRGWMYAELVDDTPTVITTRETSNIRSGPGTDNDIIFKAEKGVPFKVLQRRGEWINIEHDDGDVGWIHEMLVW